MKGIVRRGRALLKPARHSGRRRGRGREKLRRGKQVITRRNKKKKNTSPQISRKEKGGPKWGRGVVRERERFRKEQNIRERVRQKRKGEKFQKKMKKTFKVDR